MEFWVLLWIIATLVFLILLVWLYRKAVLLQRELSDLRFSKDSQSVKYGKLTEQWIPFSEKFPYSRERFRFLGNPIDGIVFGEDKLVFVEFKTASSQLNDNQKKVKSLVEQKKVEWFEFRVK